MTEWEDLLFVCIVGMALLATIAFLFGKIGDLWLAVADSLLATAAILLTVERLLRRKR